MQRVQFRRYARFKTQRLYALRTVSIQILKTTKVITRDCESERERDRRRDYFIKFAKSAEKRRVVDWKGSILG